MQSDNSILIFPGTAGRDLGSFHNTDAFSLNRGKIHHVSFGSGPHVCSGLQLSRLKIDTATAVMRTVFLDIRLSVTDLGLGVKVERLSMTLMAKSIFCS